METQTFIDKYKAIFPDVTDEVAQGMQGDWYAMIAEGKTPMTAPETADAVLALFNELALEESPVGTESTETTETVATTETPNA